jgi:hypothetical protein
VYFNANRASKELPANAIKARIVKIIKRMFGKGWFCNSAQDQKIVRLMDSNSEVLQSRVLSCLKQLHCFAKRL